MEHQVSYHMVALVRILVAVGNQVSYQGDQGGHSGEYQHEDDVKMMA